MADFPSYESLGGDAVGVQIGEALFGDYALAGVPPDPGMGVWFYRTAYDALTMGPQASIAKHRTEWRALLPTPSGGWPGPSPPPVGPVAPVAPRVYSGNMCGIRIPGLPAVSGGARDASLVLSWLYSRYSPDDRQRIRQAWIAKGYWDVLLSWPDDRSVGISPDGFLGLCQELTRDGLRPTVFLLSKYYDPHKDVAGCLRNVNAVLPLLLTGPYASRICIGWELCLDGWITPEQLDALTEAIAPQCVAAQIPCYVHFQQGYSHMDHDPGGTFAGYWKRQVGKLHGILHQRDLSWDKPMYQARLVDILDRFSGKIGGTPTDNGFGTPFDCIGLEITAQPQFDGAMGEAEGDSWGHTAIMTTPTTGPIGTLSIMGSGNGGH